ncbi:MAG: DUF6901 family protein [Thermodesulfovibrionales bacterium]
MTDFFKITYIFKFKEKPAKFFELNLDPKTLNIIQKTKSHPLEWTRLDYKKCSVCNLEQNQKYCPVAVNIADIAMDFKDIFSHEEVDVLVKVEERSYLASTTIQQALSSLAGIIMATGGCPVLEYLKPMVRFHLPFASITETAFRMMSMYLMARYIVWKNGGRPDFDFEGLKKIYRDVSSVNRDFAERLRAASEKDANLNAIVNLDCFANLIPLMIEDTIEEIKPYFSAYFKDKA